jgi:hypothetical protein
VHRLVTVLIVLATAFACTSGGDSSSSTSSTTSPPTSVTTENVGGKDVHPFTVALSGGQLNVILTAAGPPSTIFMGLGVGTYSSGTCTLLSNRYLVTQAGATAQLSGTVNAGSYCVMVYDAGNQTASITYAVTVNHY